MGVAGGPAGPRQVDMCCRARGHAHMAMPRGSGRRRAEGVAGGPAEEEVPAGDPQPQQLHQRLGLAWGGHGLSWC